MTIHRTAISLSTSGNGGAVDFGGLRFLPEIGADLYQSSGRRSSFDGSLLVDSVAEGEDTHHLGGYSCLSLTLRDESGPLLRQTFRAYHNGVAESAVMVETTAIRDMLGTSVADSYFHTTFNSPVLRLAEGLSYLTYTWGLTGREETGVGGHFPDAVISSSLDQLPEQLRLADFSPDTDTCTRARKSRLRRSSRSIVRSGPWWLHPRTIC